MGDIGSHFPDDDPQYKDADSMILLKSIKEMITEKGLSIGNIDVTIMAELPKLSGYIEKMKANIAKVLRIDRDNISVKATTNEKMGAIGRGEGIAALAVSLLYS